jgi:hypothetical protein
LLGDLARRRLADIRPGAARWLTIAATRAASTVIVRSAAHTLPRVARRDIILLNALGARVRGRAATLMPRHRAAGRATRDMREGLRDADIVMMLLPARRMNGVRALDARILPLFRARSEEARYASRTRWSCIRGR